MLLAIRGGTADLWAAMFYMAGILVAVGLAVAVMAAVRRWRKHSPECERGGLTLEQAREMQARGSLTAQEFEQLRQVLLKDGNSESSR